MGWWGGEWIEGQRCEDAPCCGCCSPSLDRADDLYWEERSRYEDDDPDAGWEDEDEDWEDEEDEESDYWQAEDSALESSLFGDC